VIDCCGHASRSLFRTKMTGNFLRYYFTCLRPLHQLITTYRAAKARASGSCIMTNKKSRMLELKSGISTCEVSPGSRKLLSGVRVLHQSQQTFNAAHAHAPNSTQKLADFNSQHLIFPMVLLLKLQERRICSRCKREPM